MGVKPNGDASKWQGFENKLKSMVGIHEDCVVRIAYQTPDKSIIPISNFDDLRSIAESYCLSQSGVIFTDTFEVPLAVLVIAKDFEALAYRMEQLRLSGMTEIDTYDLEPLEIRYASVRRPVPKRMRRQRVTTSAVKSSEEEESAKAVAAVAAAIAAEIESEPQSAMSSDPPGSSALSIEVTVPDEKEVSYAEVDSVEDGFLLASLAPDLPKAPPPDRSKLIMMDKHEVSDEAAQQELSSELKSAAVSAQVMSHDAKVDSVATIPLALSADKSDMSLDSPIVSTVVKRGVSSSVTSSERVSAASRGSKMSTIFVSGGPSYMKSNDKMRKMFAKFGTIQREMYNKQKAKHAFIYKEAESAQKAFDEMNGQSIDGSIIYVSIHETRKFLATVPPSPALKSTKSLTDTKSVPKKEEKEENDGVISSSLPGSAVSPQSSTTSESTTSSRVSVTSAEVSLDRAATDVTNESQPEPGAESKSDDDDTESLSESIAAEANSDNDDSLVKDDSVGIPTYTVPPTEVTEAYKRADKVERVIDLTKISEDVIAIPKESDIPVVEFERNRSIPAPEYDRPDSSVAKMDSAGASMAEVQSASKQIGDLQNMMATLMKTVTQSVVNVSTGRTRGTESVSSHTASESDSSEVRERKRRHHRRDRKEHKKRRSGRSSHRRRSRHRGRHCKRRKRGYYDSSSESDSDKLSTSEPASDISTDSDIDITDDEIAILHNPTPSGSMLAEKKEEVAGGSGIIADGPTEADDTTGEVAPKSSKSISKDRRSGSSSRRKKRKKHHHRRRRESSGSRSREKYKQHQSLDKLVSVVDSLTTAVGDFNRTATQLQSSVMQMSFYNQSLYSTMMSASSAAPPGIPPMPGTSLASSGHVSGSVGAASMVVPPPPPAPWMSFTPPMDPHSYQQFVQWQRQQQTVPVSKSPAHSGSSGAALSGSSTGKTHDSPTMSSIIASSEMTRSKLAQLEHLKAQTHAGMKSAKASTESPSSAPLTSSPVIVAKSAEVERHSRISSSSDKPSSVVDLEQKLRILTDRGFTNEMFNKILLKQHNGDLVKVLEDLSKLPSKSAIDK